MVVVLMPVMTIMWMATTACIVLTIPKLTLLGSMTIEAAVTCTDLILSQAVAKGLFADKYVPRALRELISAEAGANDGFALAFLLLAVYLIRHADTATLTFKSPEIAARVLSGGEKIVQSTAPLAEGSAPLIGGAGTAAPVASENLASMVPVFGEVAKRATEAAEGEIDKGIGRLGGGITKAIEMWFVEGWLYAILLSVAIGIVVGISSMYAIKFALKKKWIDGESFLLCPTAIGLFLVGICGALGTDDFLACFTAGCALNWNGLYLEESQKRHDEVNSCMDVLLNFGGFMYIGTIIPWAKFQQPDITGISVGRLVLLGVLIMFFRCVPAIMLLYKTMPKCVKDWKEALFMGWSGAIGIGAVFYAKHIKYLFPSAALAQTQEETDMMLALDPVVYWLALFSIIFHGLSIPALNALYAWKGVEPVMEDDAAELRLRSEHEALPKNSYVCKRGSVIINDRFSRPSLQHELTFVMPSGNKERADMF